MAKSCQILLQEAAGSVREVPLTGAQEGLILTITPQNCLVHWPVSVFGSGDIRLVGEAMILPNQEGSTLYDTDAISNSDNACTACAREVFMIR
jgi:hypothetical protein